MKLKFGVIGISKGNGHPYSWSSIFNGFDPLAIKQTGFPVIEKYLSERIYPNDFIQTAQVTHVWTQNTEKSKKISRAALIPNVCENYTDMITQVDAILLARDDAKNHLRFAEPFLKAGLPVYIDKPFALNATAAAQLYNLEKTSPQIFSCTALRFAREFQITPEIIGRVGEPNKIYAVVPNSWETYAVHVIEPVVAQLEKFSKPLAAKISPINTGRLVSYKYKNSDISFDVFATGGKNSNIEIKLSGQKGDETLIFSDSFSAFKHTLELFVEFVKTSKNSIPKDNTLDIVRMIEMGM